MNNILVIDKAIKEAWKFQVSNDYKNGFLLKEDSLKNALYAHIRTKLGDNFFLENGYRIFTEFELEDKERADIAIVKLKKRNVDLTTDKLIKQVNDILVIIELKYKNGCCSNNPFYEDVKKARKYISSSKYDNTQFYLGFIHEAEYCPTQASWLEHKEQQTWAVGKLTELVAYYEGDDFVTKVMSYNKLNPGIGD